MSELTRCEADVVHYIEEAVSEDFSNVISVDNRWETFYHLSEMRKSILNWYDFREGASVLEIGGELGALTGLLCDRCRHVICYEENRKKAEAIGTRYRTRNNLHIISDLQAVSNQRFDYITMIGFLERLNGRKSTREEYAIYLEKIKGLLKENGKILLAVENRYGLKYFCGYYETYTRVPFAGINQYYEQSSGYTFSKAELEDIFDKANMIRRKFYYPLPDYKLTQLIFAEDNLPSNSIRDKVINYYVDQDSLVSCEDNLYDDIIENGVLPFMANSFLVEYSEMGDFSEAKYIALSTDRIVDSAFATIIYNSGEVWKRPLYREGRKKIVELFENIQDLKNHGINVVPHKLIDDAICMPYIKAKSFMGLLQDTLPIDRYEVIRMVEMLYDTILRSSEHVDNSRNALLTDNNKEIEFGPILKYAYIDMIPYNCFYLDEKLMFYDQEFRKENYPAKYILFRTLWYMYNYIPNFEQYFLLDYLKGYFDIKEVWDIFMSAEEKFIEQNRNHRVMKTFYDWIGVDKRRIYERNKNETVSI